jgi:hypothetical protein
MYDVDGTTASAHLSASCSIPYTMSFELIVSNTDLFIYEMYTTGLYWSRCSRIVSMPLLAYPRTPVVAAAKLETQVLHT